MDLAHLAEIMYPEARESCEDIIARYPKRDLPDGAMVTRIAPSPTGFMHMGNLYGAYIDSVLAKQSGGVFYLRIEDTDDKREVEGAADFIVSVLSSFGMTFDEGALSSGEKGVYGPYRQRKRALIYQSFAKKLIRGGRAYPCFCTEEENALRTKAQEDAGANPGYYGKWASCRDIDPDEAARRISEGQPFVLRFAANGDVEKKIKVTDLVRGTLEFPENCNDFVLLKSDGIPTYHFAHAIDDHLMGTTHVVRGEEWLGTFPYHIQLFAALGWKPPKYIHTAHMMTTDGNSKRKLSKRKDPEFSLEFYQREGYPKDSVLEYLMTLLNSNFEEWRIANPDADRSQFKFSVKKMSPSGALVDLNKLNDVSRNVISKMTAQQVLDGVTEWSRQYDKTLFRLIDDDRQKALAIFSIGRGVPKPRKDFAKWSEVRDYLSFFYDELFEPTYEFPGNVPAETVKSVLFAYKNIFDENDLQDEWFSKIKKMCPEFGFAAATKDYKNEPEKYIGHVGDISMILRVAVVGRQNSPDMYCIFKIFGKTMLFDRIDRALSLMK